MITEVYRGNGIVTLLGYLYGPGRDDTHDDPHLVAAWDPGILAHHDPGPDGDVEGGRPGAGRRGVGHDGAGARHIHIVATMVRQDGRLPRIRRDWLRLRQEATAIESEFGLRGTGAVDGSAAKHPTRAEHGKAERLGVPPARAELAGRVRHAAAASSDDLTFLTRLRVAHGALVRERVAPSGDVTGYAVALPSYRAASTGEPIYFSGSRLAPDLSLPRLRARWAQVTPMHGTRPQLWAPAAGQLRDAANTLPGMPPEEAAGSCPASGRCWSSPPARHPRRCATVWARPRTWSTRRPGCHAPSPRHPRCSARRSPQAPAPCTGPAAP